MTLDSVEQYCDRHFHNIDSSNPWKNIYIYSCLLPLWAALQDQQMGLPQASVILHWVSEHESFCPCPLRMGSLLSMPSCSPMRKSCGLQSCMFWGFSGGSGEGNGNPLQYSCLENPMDGGAWWAAVHGVARSRTRLSDFTFTFHFHALEKEMATHSSVLDWRIPGMGEPGGL